MSDQDYWWIALGLGLVVAVVAVVLLEVFLRQVHRIERDAGLIWTAGKQVAGNTATTWLLPETSTRLSALTGEAKLHLELLSRAAATKTRLRPSMTPTLAREVTTTTASHPPVQMPEHQRAGAPAAGLMSKASAFLRRSRPVAR